MEELNNTDQSLSETVGKVNDRLRLRELLLAGAASEPTNLDSDYFESLRSRARSAGENPKITQ